MLVKYALQNTTYGFCLRFLRRYIYTLCTKEFHLGVFLMLNVKVATFYVFLLTRYKSFRIKRYIVVAAAVAKDEKRDARKWKENILWKISSV